MCKAVIVAAFLASGFPAFAAPAAAPPAAAPKPKISTPPPVSKSSIEKKCGNTTYVLSTGTNGGRCGTGVSIGECKDGGNTARATCSNGCESSTGAGSCSTK